MNALKLLCKAHSVYSEANKAESLFEGLTGRMKANGWTLIYYGDGGPGDQKLGVLGLSGYTKELRAFSCSSPVKVIGLRNTLSQADKLDALAHEIGHIECGHDLGNLTDRDEAEAERFARVLCARRPRHVVRWSVAIIAALCLSFGAGVLFANRSVDSPLDLPSSAPEVENAPVSNTIGKETDIMGSWYGKLADPKYFGNVQPCGDTVSWPDGQDIAPHELYELSIPLSQQRGN